MSQPVLLTREGDVAVLTLNRPQAANAIDLAAAHRLSELADQLAAEGWARAILLRSEGKLFCAGGDVGAFRAQLDSGGDALARFINALAGELHKAILKLLALEIPIVAAVNGAAAGAGMSLVLAADLAYAGPRAKLAPAYSAIGFCADGGLSWTLPRAVGEKRAAEILLLNRTFTAEQAAAEGLVTAALAEEGEAFDAAVLEKARAAASGARGAFREVRRLLHRSARSTLAEQLDAETAAMTALAGGADVAEGLRALGEKRPPRFRD